MVSSSRPSLTQSSRELAPAFSKGKTRKIPCPLEEDRAPCVVCAFTKTEHKSNAQTKVVRVTIRTMIRKSVAERCVHTPRVFVFVIYLGGATWISEARLSRSVSELPASRANLASRKTPGPSAHPSLTCTLRPSLCASRSGCVQNSQPPQTTWRAGNKTSRGLLPICLAQWNRRGPRCDQKSLGRASLPAETLRLTPHICDRQSTRIQDCCKKPPNRRAS